MSLFYKHFRAKKSAFAMVPAVFFLSPCIAPRSNVTRRAYFCQTSKPRNRKQHPGKGPGYFANGHPFAMLARTAPSSDGPRSGPGGPQEARSTSAALTVHRGPGGPLTSCSTSAALSCPIRTPPPVKSARGCGFGPTWTQPPAFISSRVKFVYLHKHENP